MSSLNKEIPAVKVAYRGDSKKLFLEHPDHGFLPVYGERGEYPAKYGDVREGYCLRRSEKGNYYFVRAWKVKKQVRTPLGTFEERDKVLTKARYKYPYNASKAWKMKKRGGAYKWVEEWVGGDPFYVVEKP